MSKWAAHGQNQLRQGIDFMLMGLSLAVRNQIRSAPCFWSVLKDLILSSSGVEFQRRRDSLERRRQRSGPCWASLSQPHVF